LLAGVFTWLGHSCRLYRFTMLPAAPCLANNITTVPMSRSCGRLAVARLEATGLDSFSVQHQGV
jgi:hypothetical protein